MRLLLLSTIAIVTSATLVGQEGSILNGRAKIGEALPAGGIADLFVTRSPNNVPTSLNHLTAMASVIVHGTVIRALPSRETEPRAFETDAVVNVTSILRGS